MANPSLEALLEARLNGPAMAPPPGLYSNFIDPSNLQVYVIITLVFCMTFSTVAVLVRMYTKLFLIRKVLVEDYIIILGYLLAIVEAVPSSMTTRYGAGTHQWNVRLRTFFAMQYWVDISAILYAPTVFFIKLSILLVYLRIFVPNRKANMFTFVGVHAILWPILIFYLIHTSFMIFICNPREKAWNPLIQHGHCFDFMALFKSTGVFNVISDFAILVLPIRSVWKLQLPLKKKIGICAIFATGFLACITSIMRTYYTWELALSPDVTHNLTLMGLWTYAEIAIGIIISCTPIFPRFYQEFGPKIYAVLSFGSMPSNMTQSGRGTFKPGSIERKDQNNLQLKDPYGSEILSEGNYYSLEEQC